MTSLAKRLVEAGAREAETTDRRFQSERNIAERIILASLRALQAAGPSEGMIARGSAHYLRDKHTTRETWNAMLSTLISEIEATDA